MRESIPLGASSAVTPVGLSVSGTHAAVPLGNAASVAYVDLAPRRWTDTSPSRRATRRASAFVNASTVVVCNQTTDQCGKFDPGAGRERDDRAGDRHAVPGEPYVATGGRVFVVSSNLDDSYMQAGPGVVTELNPATMEMVRTFEVGTNPQYAAATTTSCTW